MSAMQRRRAATSIGGLGALVVLGVVLSFAGCAGPQRQQADGNPIPLTVTSVEAGRELYQANCAACHGVDARGGGPQSGTTRVRPPSLVSEHLDEHSDRELFDTISNGLPGGMPAWAGTLSETDRWNLVNFLRSLNGHQPSTGAQ